MLLPSTSAEMVGRGAELSRLQDAFAQAREGRPAALLVAGEAGIGKSRLLREFEAQVSAQADVLVGQCIDLGGTSTPYGPLVGILRGIVEAMGAGDAWEAAGPGREALLLLLPELADGPPDRAEASPESLREAIADLIEAYAARTPLVLIIEDLHWVDESTLTILSFLLRVVQRGRILLLLSLRTDEVGRGAPVRGFIAEAARARVLERIDVPRLDAEAGRELLERIGGAPVDDTALERLMVRSEGVPFFIEELVRCVDAPLPATLRDLLLARFEQLGDDAKRVVRVVSGSEAPLPHPLLAELAPLPDDGLDDAVREAVQAGILTVDGDDYGFRHALLREAVHDDLLPGERTRLHRAYAGALERSPLDRGRPQAALAYHWHAAHDVRRALVAAVAAMQEAKTSYAFATAARFGELALELWEQVPDAAEAAGLERVTLLSRLGSILRNAGDGERSLAVVNAALAETDADTPPSVYVRLLRDKANYLTNLGREGATPLLVEALALLDERGSDGSGARDERLRASLLNTLAGRYMVGGLMHEGIVTATEAFQAGERAGDEPEMSVAANIRGSCRVHLGDVDGGFADFEIARRYAQESRALLRYGVNYSDLLCILGRFREAVVVAEQGLADARRIGVERTSGAIMRHNMVEPLIGLGEIAHAEELASLVFRSDTLQVFRLYGLLSRVRLLAWRGQHEEAARMLREWEPSLQQTARTERQVWYSAIDMEMSVAVAAGAWDEAADVTRRMLSADGSPLGHSRRLLLESGWIVAALQARGDDSAELAESVRQAWREQPEAHRDAAWSVILDALLSGDVAQLRRAAEIVDDDGVPSLMRGVVRCELARALVDSGDRTAALQPLREAAGVAARLGHARLQSEVHAFAEASGLADASGLGVAHRGDEEAGDGVELTARERQVLELIAVGLSNRQIGERLYISAKTASVHVSAILRKLGVASRTEAAVAASRAPSA